VSSLLLLLRVLLLVAVDDEEEGDIGSVGPVYHGCEGEMYVAVAVGGVTDGTADDEEDVVVVKSCNIISVVLMN
jgi:hypothetical protein